MSSDDPRNPPSGDAPQRRPDPVGGLDAARRLLETPLLDGAEVAPRAAVPEVKPLVWEHVVRPLDGTPAGGLPRIPPPTPVAEPDPPTSMSTVDESAAPLPDLGMPRTAPPIDFAALRLGVADAVAGAGVRDDISLDAVVDGRSKDHVTAEIDRLAFVADAPVGIPGADTRNDDTHRDDTHRADTPESDGGEAASADIVDDGDSVVDASGDILIVEA
ncbi:MAG: hypothetical protein ACKO27_08800, partial [Ilumatobacteraceae bacterium]